MIQYLRGRYLDVITNSLNLHAFTLEYTADSGFMSHVQFEKMGPLPTF